MKTSKTTHMNGHELLRPIRSDLIETTRYICDI